MPDRIEWPADKEAQILLLSQLYQDSQHRLDKDIFAQIIEVTGGAISVITLKRYKAKYGWARTAAATPPPIRVTRGGSITQSHPHSPNGYGLHDKKPTARPVRRKKSDTGHQQEEAAPAFTIQRTSGVYSPSEKFQLVEAITQAYSVGEKALDQVCSDHGITYKMFSRWIASDSTLLDLYNTAISENLKSYVVVLDHLCRQALVSRLSRREMEEVRDTYEYTTQVGLNGEITTVPKLKNRTVIKRQVDPDPNTIAEAMRLVHDIKLLHATDNKPQRDVSTLSTAELDEQIRQKEEQLLKLQQENEQPGDSGTGPSAVEG